MSLQKLLDTLSSKDGVLPRSKCLAFLGAIDHSASQSFVLELLVKGLELQDQGEDIANK